jgi:hypothetical protein
MQQKPAASLQSNSLHFSEEKAYAYLQPQHQQGQRLMAGFWFVIFLFLFVAVVIIAAVAHMAKLQRDRFNAPSEAEERARFDARIMNRRRN